MARGSAAVACAVALLTSGCASEPPQAGARAAAGASASPQLSATAVYGRHAAVRERVDVRLANDGDAPVQVERLRVEHPLFDPVPALARSSTLPPDGRPRIVPVPFGAPRCDADDPTGARVVVGVRTGDDVRDVEVPLADGEPGLLRAHRLACAVQGVQAAVALDLAPFAPADDGRTALTVHRTGPGRIAVTAVEGNVLFSVDGGSAVLPEGTGAVDVPVTVRATRCDPHARIESKTSFVLPVFVSLADGEPVLVPTAVSAPARAALQELLDRTCGSPP